MQISDDSKKIGKEIVDKILECRKTLLNEGFLEPTYWTSSSWHLLFYKENTKNTAFVVNLHGNDDSIEVVYGYTSTAFTSMKGCEDDLKQWGVSDSYINIRKKVNITYDDIELSTLIKDMYEEFSHVDKSELLEIVKQKRKEFIDKVTSRLKPLGFKKKANTWIYDLKNDFYLMLNVQKSSFSDEYYFNIYIGKGNTNDYSDCFYKRIAPDNMFPMDWQLISEKKLVEFLENDLTGLLKHIVSTPLCELGKDDSMQAHCECDGKQCEYCWVKK